MSPRWTREEDFVLRRRWCRVPVVTIAYELGRTMHAVACRADALGLRQRRYGLVRVGTLARRSGHDDKRIVRAIEVLGLTLVPWPSSNVRCPNARGHRALTRTDARRVLRYLAQHPMGTPHRKPLA